MIVDARGVPNCAVLETEICIIGGGPAAISLAREFDAQAFRVILLEGANCVATAPGRRCTKARVSACTTRILTRLGRAISAAARTVGADSAAHSIHMTSSLVTGYRTAAGRSSAQISSRTISARTRCCSLVRSSTIRRPGKTGSAGLMPDWSRSTATAQ